jgi:CBS domain-containing protein
MTSTARRDELLERATAKLLEYDVGRLPVVSRDDPRLVGTG